MYIVEAIFFIAGLVSFLYFIWILKTANQRGVNIQEPPQFKRGVKGSLARMISQVIKLFSHNPQAWFDWAYWILTVLLLLGVVVAVVYHLFWVKGAIAE